MANNSDWLGACAIKGRTASNTTNTANALTCFRTIVLRLWFSRASNERKMPLGMTRLIWDATAPESVSLRGWCGAGGSRVAFDVVGVPSEVAIKTVLDVRRRFEFVIFAGVDDEFGGAAKALESLVHLLAADNGDIPIDVAAHEKSRGGDVGDSKEGRDFLPESFVLPGMAEFHLVVPLVFVVAVEAGEEGASCAGDSGFEAGSLGDDEVRGNAAVGPAADGELVRVGDALSDGVVHHSHIVLKVLVAPISPDGLGVVLAVAGGAARVREEHGVAVCCQKLGQVIEFGVISPDGTAMRTKDGGVLLAGDVIHGLVKVAGNSRAVLALEMDVLGVGELELAHEGVVGVGNADGLGVGSGREGK